MEMNIISKTEKPMLDRIELTAEMTFTGAVPSREELTKKIASKESVAENLIVVKKVKTMSGFGKSTALVYVYNDEASLKKLEYEYIVNRGKPKKEAEKKE